MTPAVPGAEFADAPRPRLRRAPASLRARGGRSGGAEAQISRHVAYGLMTPAVACVALLFALPIVKLVWLSVQVNGHFSWGNYQEFFDTSGYVHSLVVTLVISAATAVVCALVGYPLAMAITRAGRRLASLMLGLTVVPFWSSLLILGFIWDVLLAPSGALQDILADLHIVGRATDVSHTTAGLILGLAQYMLPYMVLPIVAALRSIDPALPRAARSLGAGPWRTFIRVTIPLSVPGLMSGGMLVFLIAIGSYVLPSLLGPPSDQFLSQVIDVQVDQVLNWGAASAMAVVLVAIALLVFAIYVRVFGLARGFGGR